MVSEEAKWVLTHTKIDPLKVAQAFGCTEQECWEYLEGLRIALNEAEETYQAESAQRRLDLQAFIDDIPEANEVRRQALLEKLHAAKRDPDNHPVKRLLAETRAITNKEDRITQQDILRAKEHPITDILNVQRPGNISCPFHKDKNPSFHIKKNNTYTCYSCGIYGDAIDLYMKLHNVKFNEAVKRL